MIDDKPLSPEIGEIHRSPEGFTSEPLGPETSVPAPGRAPQVPPPAVSETEPGHTEPRPVEKAPAIPQEPVAAPIPEPKERRGSSDEPLMPPKRKKSGSLLKWLIIMAVGLFVVSVGSLFWSSPSFSDRDVVLTLEGPDRATSGDEVTYTLKWKNNTKLDLHDMKFRLFYPDDSVVIVDGAPTQPDSEGFEVESLKPGMSGERQITLFLVGDKGGIKDMTVNLIFRAGTLRSAFEKEVKVNTTITDLPVALTLTAPPTKVSGQPVTYIVDVRNETDEDFVDMRLELEYPEGFTVRDVTPSSDGGSTSRWTIDELLQGEGLRFTIEGSLSGVQGEAKTVSAVLKRKVGEQYIDYVRTDSLTMLSSPLLSTRIEVNGSRDHAAHPGESLKYVFHYSNNSNQNLIGLSMSLQLDGQMFDFDRLQAPNGFFDESINTVRFSSSGVSDFAVLPPGKSGKVEVTIPLKSSFVGGGTGSFFVKASTRLSTPNVPTGVQGSEVFAQDVLTTKIVSQPTLAETVAVAGGATPLQVGQKTNFTVSWSITNPGNEMRDATVTTLLPPGVSFDGTEFGGAATFDTNSNRVTWDVGNVPFGTGVGVPRKTTSFQISTTPSSNQKGDEIQILNNAILSGTDSFTGQNVQSVFRAIFSGDVQGLEDERAVQ